MKKIIEKAETLIEALPYIQKFRGEVIVVKLGGSAMEEKDNCEDTLADVTFMECVGMLPVIVHGGGKAISRRMADANLRARFVRGLRVTDEATIQIVVDVLTSEINPELVAIIEAKGGKARTVRGETVFQVARRTETDPKTGETLDWGFVGEIRGVDTAPILACLRGNCIPVITPLGRGPDGATYNLNADDAAAAAARELRARKLAFLSDVPGLLRDPNDPESIFSTLRVDQVEDLIRNGVIDGGMLPKIAGAVAAIQAGVVKVHIIDGRVPHSLLLEIFTDKGIGTEIVHHDEA